MSDRFTTDKLAWIEQITQDPELGHFAARVGVVIASHLNRETGDAWPGQERLAALCGATERGVRKAVDELATRHHMLVEVNVGRGRSSRYRPLLHSEKRNGGSGFDARKSGTVVPGIGAEKRNETTRKSGTVVPPNTMKEPIERIAAAAAPECQIEAEAIFRLIPNGSASRSNRGKVRQAVSVLEAEGISPKALRIAVTAFVADSPNAKDQNGRFMGPAHTWLTEKRGWEAYLPSRDRMFLDGRPESEATWLHRVRAWQEGRPLWRIKRDDFGPEPGQPGCRVPAEILDYCLANPAPTITAANDAEKPRRQTWV